MTGPTGTMEIAQVRLASAYADWARVYGSVRRTLRYEDLIAVAEKLDDALAHLILACTLPHEGKGRGAGALQPTCGKRSQSKERRATRARRRATPSP